MLYASSVLSTPFKYFLHITGMLCILGIVIVLCDIMQLSCVLFYPWYLNSFCHVTGILCVIHNTYIDFFDRYSVWYYRYCDSSLLHYTDILCAIHGIQIFLFVTLQVSCVLS